MTRFSRRALVAGGMTASALAVQAQAPADDNPVSPSSLSAVDFRKLLSRADLIYDKPVPRSEEGMPIGNGRMGSLVWTTPRQLRFQINRADVYASNSASNSFFERHNDYCGGCAYFDVDLPDAAGLQHLSVYDGVLSIDS